MIKNKFIILSLLVVLLCCVSAASAADIDNTDDIADDIAVDEVSEIVEEVETDDVQEDVVGECSQTKQVSKSESQDEPHIIYVCSNNTGDGDGSPNNPYANFNLACKDVEEGKDKVIINVYDGEYSIDSFLIFNTTNLTINGLGSNVIFTDSKEGTAQSEGGFKLSNSGIFSLYNVIISPKASNEDSVFNIFSGATDLATFKNCTFYNKDTSTFNSFQYGNATLAGQKPIYNYKYISCSFINCNFKGAVRSSVATFENCFINEFKLPILSSPAVLKKKSVDTFGGNLTFKNCFIMTLPTYKSSALEYFNKFVHIDRNVKLEVNLNYLGNNSFEINGKLIGDDGSSEGIELIPMSQDLKVSFESKYYVEYELQGKIQSQEFKRNDNIQSEDYLKNGTFKIIYNTGSHIPEYTGPYDVMYMSGDYDFIIYVHFGSQTTKLQYTNYVNVSLFTPKISYGDPQNINITFSDIQDGILYVNVDNNKTYNQTFGNQKEIIFNIPHVLSGGTHKITVSFIDEDSKIYGFNSTDLVVKEQLKTNIVLPELVPGKATNTTITLPENATGNITVSVDGNVVNVVSLVNGSATVTIPELGVGKHNVTIAYSGDGNYSRFSQTSDVEVKETEKPISKPESKTESKTSTNKKVKSVIVAKKKTFKAKTKVKKYTITLKSGKTLLKKVKVTLKVKGKTYKATTNKKGKATFKIKNLKKKGKYTVIIKFAGKGNYKATTKKVKLTVKK